MPVYPFLVACDGSDGTQDALYRGLAEAGRRRLPVQVVTVLDAHRFPLHALHSSAAAQAMTEADPVLDQAVREACVEAPDVTGMRLSTVRSGRQSQPAMSTVELTAAVDRATQTDPQQVIDPALGSLPRLEGSRPLLRGM